jgi:hypothetical protein
MQIRPQRLKKNLNSTDDVEPPESKALPTAERGRRLANYLWPQISATRLIQVAIKLLWELLH